ncbi:SMP-30/gluconolactonase/LRE family protein [Streptomyces sp. NBC_00250]|uniref:SMP-30/gluconolactonase/LRE family protein n=1 Tax=Streptomyces sp. NBC_00250 TaxID=2903641 RepID=UPI003FA78357
MIEVAVRERAELGDGPTWDPAVGRLVWVDILGSRVHTYDPASGRRTVLAAEQHVGAAKPRASGGLAVNLRDGVGVYDAQGAFSRLHHEPVPGRRGNDSAVAPDGALRACTMRYDEAPGGGTLSRVAPGGTVRTVSAMSPSATAPAGVLTGGGCTPSTRPPAASTSSASAPGPRTR